MIVVVDRTKTIEVGGSETFRCGRLDNPAEGIVGLDPLDLSISRRAFSIQRTDAGWTISNTSSSQPVFVENVGSGPLSLLAPGGRHLIDRHTSGIEVRGSIRTHRIDILVEVNEPLRIGVTDHDTPVGWRVDTLIDVVELTENEREALVALFSGYLECFPRRDCEPLSYAQAAVMLGISTTALRRRVERVRTRLRRQGVFLEGPSAKHQLATYLLDRQIIGADDLELIRRGQR